MMAKTFCVWVMFMLTSGAAFAQGGPERGREVYAAEKCVACHSIAGVGNRRGALDGVGSKLSADQLRQWIVNAPEMTAKTQAARKPVMKAYAHLTKEDVETLVAYLQTLK